jgi:uncharacterized membrane protein YciS (DUF1049 family)
MMRPQGTTVLMFEVFIEAVIFYNLFYLFLKLRLNKEERRCRRRISKFPDINNLLVMSAECVVKGSHVGTD